MKLTHMVKDGICVIAITGNLALSENQELENYLSPLIHADEVKHVLLNFSHVNLIDSRGVGLIAGSFQDLEGLDKTLSLCGLNENCLNVLKALKLDKIIDIFESEDEALAKVAEA